MTRQCAPENCYVNRSTGSKSARLTAEPGIDHATIGMEWTTEILSGFGRSSSSSALVCTAGRESNVIGALEDCRGGTCLARGAGLSYGDAAQNGSGRVIRTTALRTIHSFDTNSGQIVVGPGVTFGQLLREYATRGWIPPVTPGTQFVTVAGAVANDVHGKSHDVDGSFGDQVVWFQLVLPSGETLRVDPTSDPALFAATVGGIGLTGILTRICFQMRRTVGTRVRLTERRIAGIGQFLDELERGREPSPLFGRVARRPGSGPEPWPGHP